MNFFLSVIVIRLHRNDALQKKNVYFTVMRKVDKSKPYLGLIRVDLTSSIIGFNKFHYRIDIGFNKFHYPYRCYRG